MQALMLHLETSLVKTYLPVIGTHMKLVTSYPFFHLGRFVKFFF